MKSKLVAGVTVQVEVIGITPLSFGKHHEEPHLSNEKDSAYEVRTYREKLHVNEAGEIYVPDMMFKKSLDAACRHKGEKIPGRAQRNLHRQIRERMYPEREFRFNGQRTTNSEERCRNGTVVRSVGRCRRKR